MRQYLRYISWFMGFFTWLPEGAGAAPCIRLTGMVRDYTSHQPLTAQLYLTTATGRHSLGYSTETGQFSVEIACESKALVIEKPGYRAQLLALNMTLMTDSKAPVSVIIPLLAVDQRGNDRPYQQTEQTYYVQSMRVSTTITHPQRNVFTISDALSGVALPAQTCFFFTRTGQKRCLTSDAFGRFNINFTETDIVAFEVTSPGYQTYKGNFSIEQLDRKQLQHTIRLSRELTLLSVRLKGEGGSCELRPGKVGSQTTDKVIILEPVPGTDNALVACGIRPQPYTLSTYDRQHTLLKQQPVVLNSGLNLIAVDLSDPQRAGPGRIPPTGKPIPAVATTNLDFLDSLPMLYFEQGDYKLQTSSELTLLQVASYLTQHPKVNVQLAGHTDKEGDERLNRSLAEYRAKVVSTFLYQHGITDDRMQLVGYGSRFPVAPSDTEENKAKNRRVAMKLIAN